jgi:hypothetical protein
MRLVLLGIAPPLPVEDRIRGKEDQMGASGGAQCGDAPVSSTFISSARALSASQMSMSDMAAVWITADGFSVSKIWKFASRPEIHRYPLNLIFEVCGRILFQGGKPETL